MYKIAFLTFIAIVALGVYASAQDPGMPDSAALGNPDCSPLYMRPGEFTFLRLWFKNDEDLEYIIINCGMKQSWGIPVPYIPQYPLTEWDAINDTAFVPQDMPGYIFVRITGIRRITYYSDNPYLNTNSEWQHIMTIGRIFISDSLAPGDTILPLLSFQDYAACASPIIVVDPQSSDDAGDLPREFAITNIAPNPFNPQTTIHYALPEASDVSLTVYDILGRKIETLDIGYQNTGEHSIAWNASGRNSGVYFARLVAGGRSQVGRMVLVK